ncbi:phage antirepressor protein [Eggerthella sp. NSJ-70]|uniref:Phage antirepressor protein n=1 Tax=Eggerthella hominis TaxID=2763043 RepID=A0ABR7BQK4_9ACTN|nr:BRO family protein [Eggerthella hominis]MBC5583899.1 phage antirepressor protein [Eggerthella hominis]
MAPIQSLKLYEDSRIRALWNDDEEEWYFSVVDVVAVLTESSNPRRYWSDLKRKLQEEGSQLYDKIVQLKMKSDDGKLYKTDVATTSQILRIVQSVPSPKAEPFKLWLAQVGAERIEETVDPEQGIDRALETYLKKGYSPEWVNQRLQTISVRKELTDEWIERGVSKGSEFAILTDEISKAWAGMTTRQYKNHKGLTKENLRDNMSTLELVLNMLAEATTTELSKVEEPETFEQSKGVAQRGGSVAGNAREEIEAQTGRPVVTSKNAQDFRRVLGEVIEAAAELGDGRRAEEGPDV